MIKTSTQSLGLRYFHRQMSFFQYSPLPDGALRYYGLPQLRVAGALAGLTSLSGGSQAEFYVPYGRNEGRELGGCKRRGVVAPFLSFVQGEVSLDDLKTRKRGLNKGVNV